jgi:hypothetical protein
MRIRAYAYAYTHARMRARMCVCIYLFFSGTTGQKRIRASGGKGFARPGRCPGRGFWRDKAGQVQRCTGLVCCGESHRLNRREHRR